MLAVRGDMRSHFGSDIVCGNREIKDSQAIMG